MVGSGREEVAAFLHPRPVGELHGIGRAHERTLTTYGVYTIVLRANLPEAGRCSGCWAERPTGCCGSGPRS